MVIQAILITAILLLLIFFFRNQSSHQLSAWSKILMTLFVIVAIFVVLFPDSSNDVAHMVGVSRGADLLLYVLTLLFVMQVIINYITRRRDEKKFAKIGRKIALLQADIDYPDRAKIKR